MKCHSCHTEPATVGLLCRGCVDRNRTRGEQRKVATINQIRQQSEKDSLIHKAMTRWEFQVFALCAFFALCLGIISTTGKTAAATFPIQLLVALLATTALTTLLSYMQLWLAMYRNNPHQGGLFTIVLYILFPGVAWRWAFANLKETWRSILVHFVSIVVTIFAVNALASELEGTIVDAAKYVIYRNAQPEPTPIVPNRFYHAD